MGNFSFLREGHDPVFFELAEEAERFLADGKSNAMAWQLRMLADAFTIKAGARSAKQIDRIRELRSRRLIDAKVFDAFDEVRRVGNSACHEVRFKLGLEAAVDLLEATHRLAVWFHVTFSPRGTPFPSSFLRPAVPTVLDRGATGIVPIGEATSPDGKEVEISVGQEDKEPATSDFHRRLAAAAALNPIAYYRTLQDKSAEVAASLDFQAPYLGADLVVFDGQLRLSNRILMLRKLESIVGRSSECDLVLDENSVSRQHARITIVGERLRVEDLGSRNGTWKDGARLTECWMSDRQIVRFGRVPVAFVRSERPD